MKKIVLALLLIFIACLFALTIKAQSFDSCTYYHHQRDSISQHTLILAEQVQWVQYYLGVIAHNPKDAKYDKGWLTRAVASKLPPNPFLKSLRIQKTVNKIAQKRK